MTEKRVRTIDITPYWAPLITALLNAYANCYRMLWADEHIGCRIREDEDFCDTHESYLAATNVCERAIGTSKEMYQWRQERRGTMRNVESELTRLAKHVDNLNAKTREKNAGPNGAQGD